MEALTIFGAVTGSISAASEILKALDKAISTASKFKDAPEQAISTLRDVRMMRVNMIRFKTLLDKQADARDRGVHIPLDDARDTFTDCVTSLDELENLLRPLNDPGLQPLDLTDRLDWAMKDKRVDILSKRVHDAQASLGLMLTILSHESLIEVQKALATLPGLTQKIGNNVAHLHRPSHSVKTLNILRQINQDNDEDDNSTIRPFVIHRSASGAISKPRSDSILIPETLLEANESGSGSVLDTPAIPLTSRFAFEEALVDSRPYRRAPDWDLDDISYRSSVINAHALSLLSKLSSLSLGDVSHISFIALPLICTDLSNAQYYHFGETIEDADQMKTMEGPQYRHSKRSSVYLDQNSSVVDLSPLPRSPTSPMRDRITTVFHTIRKPFELDAAEMKGEDNAWHSLASPPVTPSAPSARYRALSSKPGDESLTSPHMVLTMAELSTLQLRNSEIHFFHGHHNLPCCGALNETQFQDTDEENIQMMQQWQLDLAASHKFLDNFRCKNCKRSLDRIIQVKSPGWSDVELWCGSGLCLSTAQVTPCQCWYRIKDLQIPTDSFFGCRIKTQREVKCARCFDRCQQCHNEIGLVVSEHAETMNPEASELYLRQHILLAAQRWLFKNVRVGFPNDLWESKLGLHIFQTDGRLDRLSNAPKRTTNILRKRQRELLWRQSQYPMWKQMSCKLDDGSRLQDIYLGKMKQTIDDLDERLDWLDSQNHGYVPVTPDLDFESESDGKLMFEQVEMGLVAIAMDG